MARGPDARGLRRQSVGRPERRTGARAAAGNAPRAVAFSPDGETLLTITPSGYQFWAVGSWNPGRCIAADRAGSPGVAAFTGDGKMLAIAYSPYVIHLLEAATGRQLAALEAPDPAYLSGLCFSRDGSQLAAATENHVIQVWDLRRIRSS